MPKRRHSAEPDTPVAEPEPVAATEPAVVRQPRDAADLGAFELRNMLAARQERMLVGMDFADLALAWDAHLRLGAITTSLPHRIVFEGPFDGRGTATTSGGANAT